MKSAGCGTARDPQICPGLSAAEAQTHMAAWCIVSAPLTLSMDLTDKAAVDESWPLISNKEALDVNDDWAGFSGSLFKVCSQLLLCLSRACLSKLLNLSDPVAWVPPGLQSYVLVRRVFHTVGVGRAGGLQSLSLGQGGACRSVYVSHGAVLVQAALWARRAPVNHGGAPDE
eukprot:COSAG06_NODE_5505_length_3438_cov_12.431156_2_plen_172_part_00